MLPWILKWNTRSLNLSQILQSWKPVTKESTVEETYMTEEVTSSKTRLQSPRKSTSVLEAQVFGTEELPGKSESK